MHSITLFASLVAAFAYLAMMVAAEYDPKYPPCPKRAVHQGQIYTSDDVSASVLEDFCWKRMHRDSHSSTHGQSNAGWYSMGGYQS